MILENLATVDTNEMVNIRIDGDKIAEISASPINGDNTVLSFEKCVVFPGLINSHDHLDFNLYPQLGNRIYNNYMEWGKYIHQNYKEEITAVLQVPAVLRYEWGVFKNLLCGVTTVVNHGEPSGLKDAVITVFEDAQSLHSIGFESGWRIKLNNPFHINQPVCIHVGEGDDWPSFSEIGQLTSWNLLQRKLIGVHAVSMPEKQASKFEALVWCPVSNSFLLNKTAPFNMLEKHTEILFGTDSTLTAGWDIWEHLRFARKTRQVSDQSLYRALNKNPAKVWRLNSGALNPGKDADIVIAKTPKGTYGLGAFFSIRPADIMLIVHKGQVRLFDEKLVGQLPGIDLDNFSKIYVGGVGKYVQGNLPALMQHIKEYYAGATFPVTEYNAA